MTAEKDDETDVPSDATTLGLLGNLRCYLQNADVASNTMMLFNVLEKLIVEAWSKQKQTSINDFLKEEKLAFLNVNIHLCKMKFYVY